MCHIKEGIRLERSLIKEMMLETKEQLMKRTYGELEHLHMQLKEMGCVWAIPEVSDAVIMRRTGIPLQKVQELREDVHYIDNLLKHLEVLMDTYPQKKMTEEMSQTTHVVITNVDVAYRMLDQGYSSRQICLYLGALYPSKHMSRVRSLAKRFVRNGEEHSRKAGWLLYALRKGTTLEDMVNECPEEFPSVAECRKLLIGIGLTHSRITDLDIHAEDMQKSKRQLQHVS
ncbi:hypothetical protein [Bacillus thuringiensis]|uniref:hypothetical protein n=1 Tax=Bacillus thuringiensis TaxID=1428 RepID=UPI000BFC6F55|nr:hypothetical protein [Bacillus thuringiensis]PGT89962.1 hypothetical protein COD17_09440 [Bacillus thuringiensis]